MNHAKLSNSLREGRFDCLPDTGEIICTGNQDVFYSTGFDIRENIKPEGCTFGLADPHSQNLLVTGLLQSDHQVDGFTLHLAVLPHLKHDAVHPDNKVHRIKRSLLPLLDVFKNSTGNVGD